MQTILISWEKNNSSLNYINWIKALGYEYSYTEGDLLLVVGGADIGKYPNRDEHENNLIRKFKAAGKPIFGICRGMQLLGVHEGLELKQHLPDIELLLEHRSDSENHLGESQFHLVQALDIDNEYSVEFKVNSRHHQGFIQAENQKEWIVSEDDVIEGMKRDWFSAVQYHPEREELKNTFAELLAACEITRLLNKND